MGIIYAMSDIHGYYDVMEKNLDKINFEDADIRLVLCGDYIDYGPDSCKVLYRIKELMEIYPRKVIALKGNHETMFLDFLDASNLDVWNVEWLAAYKEFLTINTFISENMKKQIRNLQLEDSIFELDFKLAKLIKEDIKTHHKELIKWIRNLPFYYETEKQIFVHAGIDEEAGYCWKFGTPEEVFVGKYPATFGHFYKDIIAGHTGTYSLKDEEGFYGIYWDKESHYYIDGTVEISGNIPLLIYDDMKEEYIY